MRPRSPSEEEGDDSFSQLELEENLVSKYLFINNIKELLSIVLIPGNWN